MSEEYPEYGIKLIDKSLELGKDDKLLQGMIPNIREAKEAMEKRIREKTIDATPKNESRYEQERRINGDLFVFRGYAQSRLNVPASRLWIASLRWLKG